MINSSLKAIRQPVLSEDAVKTATVSRGLPYRADLINSSQDLNVLLQAAKATSHVRLCLYGPPGTGKSAFGRALAERLKKPLMVRGAAHLLHKHVGESEQRVQKMFDSAEKARAVLLLDEADSFFIHRDRAMHSWEVTLINQFLSSLERFDGVFIATTNRIDTLDPASARRMDFKVHLDYLLAEQAFEMVLHVCRHLRVKISGRDHSMIRNSIEPLRLTHGDYAVAMRQLELFGKPATVESLLKALAGEATFREPERQGMGFVVR